jgi:hypothetical protein
MTASILPFGIVFGFVVLAQALSWSYFRRYQVTRPPIGVFNLGDVAFMLAGVVIVPPLYLVLPVWLVMALLVIGLSTVIYLVWEPVVRARWAIWLITFVCVAADGAAAASAGTQSQPFMAVNNVLQVMAAVGVAVLWAQSGMKARDAAVLGAALAVYDYVFTARLPLMQDLTLRLSNLPYAPQLAWPLAGAVSPLSLGLGDLLLALVFPLVMRKAFGRPAGLAALTITLIVLAGLLASFYGSLLQGTFPVMVVLGPLMAAQYWYWRRRCGRERAWRTYQLVEP